jgi:hypothetical protein
MGRDAACHSSSDEEIDAHGGEESAGPGCSNNGQSHNEADGIIGGNVQRLEGSSSVECELGSSHSGVEQPTTTDAERQQEKERELKGKQRQRKKATTLATLEEALARVDTAGVSLDALNVLDAAIVYAKRILEHGGASSSTDAPVVSSSSSSDLPELLRQAEEKALNLRREMRAMAEAAAFDLLEQGQIRSAVAKLSVRTQEQSRIEPLPTAT